MTPVTPIETQVRVTTDSGTGPIATTSALAWYPDDPAAVEMRTVCTYSRVVVIWRFARQLIHAALSVDGGSFGVGDVSATTEADAFIFRLTSPEGTCYVTWPLDVVRHWHALTVADCEPGTEDEGARYTAGLDNELAALIERGTS